MTSLGTDLMKRLLNMNWTCMEAIKIFTQSHKLQYTKYTEGQMNKQHYCNIACLVMDVQNYE